MANNAGMGSQLKSNPIVAAIKRCFTDTPLVTRILLCLYAVTLLPAFPPYTWIHAPLLRRLALCGSHVNSSTIPPLHRLLFAAWQHTDLVSGLLSCFTIMQIGSRIELQRGSIFFAQLWSLTWLLVHGFYIFLMHTVLQRPEWVMNARDMHVNLAAPSLDANMYVPLWGAHPAILQRQSSYSWAAMRSAAWPTQTCIINNWAMVFAIMVYEANRVAMERRRFVFLIPTALPTRIVSLILFCAHQIWFGFQLHAWLGVMAGYALCLLPSLPLPRALMRTCEVTALTSNPSFVTIARAGTMQPYKHYEYDPAADDLQPSINGPSAAAFPSARSTRIATHSPARAGMRGRLSAADSTWRRMDVSSSDSESGSESSTSTDTSTDEEEADARQADSSGQSQNSNARGPATSASHAHAAINTNASVADHEEATDPQTAALAGNIARILSPPYPKQQPSDQHIERIQEIDKQLQQLTQEDEGEHAS